MSVIRFAVADAADIRFCVSPLWETVRSRYAVEDAGRHAVHLPWVRAVRGLDCDPVLRAVSRPGAYLPDFLTPPPSGPLATLDEELAVVAATPPDVVVADLRSTARRRPLAVALDDPAGLRDRLCAAVRAWHDAAIAPHWPRMRALLDADIAYRSRQLAEGGLRRLVDTLHPSVRWAGDRIVADDPWDLDLDLRGRGLPLMPSVFVDRRVLWPVRPESPPLAVYPVRAAATLWEAAPATDAAPRRGHRHGPGAAARPAARPGHDDRAGAPPRRRRADRLRAPAAVARRRARDQRAARPRGALRGERARIVAPGLCALVRGRDVPRRPLWPVSHPPGPDGWTGAQGGQSCVPSERARGSRSVRPSPRRWR